MSLGSRRIYSFGGFVLDIQERRLRSGDREIYLPPKTFDTLKFLVERHGSLVGKDELIEQLWKDTFVTDNALTRCIKEVRQALCDDARNPRFIETVPRIGYRFVAEVETIQEETEEEFIALEAVVEESREEGPWQLLEKFSQSRALQLWLAMFLTLTLALVLIYFVNRDPFSAGLGAAKPEGKTVAVLPFQSLEAGQKNLALELGLADSLITRLSRIEELIVRPTGAVRRYLTNREDPVAAGRELQVVAVIDGSVLKFGDRLRVTVQVVNVEDGRTLWAAHFEENFSDVFRVLDSISEKVAAALGLQLAGETGQLLTKDYTRDSRAFLEYLQGRYLSRQRSEEALRKAVDHFRRAVGIDPNYALAYTGLADGFSALGTFLPPKAVYPQAEAAARRALEIDGELAEALVSMAVINADYYWNWEAAEQQFTRAITLSPNYPVARTEYALYLTLMGRFQEALMQLEKAQSLEPLSPLPRAASGWVYYMDGQYEKSLQALQDAVALDPAFVLTHLNLGLLWLETGKYEDAVSAFEKALELSGGAADIVGLTGYSYARAGQTAQALETIRRLETMSRERYVTSFATAIVYMGLGDNDRAFQSLDRAYGERTWHLGMLKMHPHFDSLRGDPRFQQLLKRVGLADSKR